MEYLGTASRVDAARYRSDIVVSGHLSQSREDEERPAEATRSPSHDMFYTVLQRRKCHFTS